MNRISVFVIVFSIMLVGTHVRAQGTFARVTADNVNLRAKATDKSEVVVQAQLDDQLTVLAVEPEWVQIQPPKNVYFWVHRDFVSNGQVKAKNLRVRAGPGINYSIVGSLIRGDQIETLGEFGDWLKVVPPKGASLWVSKQLVEIARPEPQRRYTRQPRRTPLMGSMSSSNISRSTQIQQVVRTTRYLPSSRSGTRPSSQNKSEKQISTQAAPPPRRAPPPRTSDLKPEWKLIPLEGQGKTVEREGILKKYGFLAKRPTSFRLIRQEGTRSVTLCYLRGNDAQLRNFVHERLLIRGREYWIRGSDYAILVVDQVTPMSHDSN